MRPASLILPFAALGLLMLAAVPASSGTASSPSVSATSANPVAARTLPIAWIPNAGQHDSAVAFYGRAGNVEAWLTSEGAVLSMRDRRSPRDPNLTGAAVRFRFGDTSKPVRSEGLSELAGRVSYLRGASPTGCFTDLPTFEAVSQKGTQSGIEVVWRDADHRVSYDVIADAGASIGAFTIDVDGANRLDVLPSGELVIETAIGELRQSIPSAYAVAADGSQRDLSVAFRRVDTLRFGFDVKDLRPEEAVSIRPTFTFVSYLGDVALDGANAITTTADGATILAGTSTASTYPTTPGCFDASAGARGDAFVMKLDADGTSVAWCTVIGGSGHDEGAGLAVDPLGRIFVGGSTSGPFPNTAVTSAAGSSEGSDAWVGQLSSKGLGFVWCTRFGGSSNDVLRALSVGSDGVIRATGSTSSSNFPVSPNAAQSTSGGGVDAFLVGIESANGALASGTYLGGNGDDEGRALTLGKDGAVIVAGTTASDNFLPRAEGHGDSANTDAFVVAVSDPALPVVGVRFGGPSNDSASGIAVDAEGRILVVGRAGPGFPGVGASNGEDGFLACLSPTASRTLWTSVLGGSGDDGLNTVTVDNSGTVWVAGSSDSPSIPGVFGEGSRDDGSSGFLVAFESDGRVDAEQRARSLGTAEPRALAWNAHGGGIRFVGDAVRADSASTPAARSGTAAIDLATCGMITITPTNGVAPTSSR